MDDFDISGVLDQMPGKNDKPNRNNINEAHSATGEAGESRSSVVGNGAKELSAQSLARLLGIASTTDIAALETKLDRLLTKLSLVTTKVERISSDIEDLPDTLEKLHTSLKQVKELVRAPSIIDVTTPS